MTVREFKVRRTLESMQGLRAELDGLTYDEVMAALEFETASRRRSSVVNRLIARLVRLNELEFRRQITEKFQWHANPPKS